MATDTESMHENMTRLRMRMVQQKLANEREKLQSGSSENGYDDQLKLRQAMIKRQELLDKIRNEQIDDKRPRTYTPRRRYTPSPLPPPSRRSLPDLSKQYHFINAAARNPPAVPPLELHIIHQPNDHSNITSGVPSNRGSYSSTNKGNNNIIHSSHDKQNINNNNNNQKQVWVASPRNSVILESMEEDYFYDNNNNNNSSSRNYPEREDVEFLDPSTYKPLHQQYQSIDRDQQHSLYFPSQRRLPSRVTSLHEFPVSDNYNQGYDLPTFNQYQHPQQQQSIPPIRRHRPRVVIKQTRTSPRRSRTADMAQVKHVIEHQFRSAPQQQQQVQQHHYSLPPIQTAPVQQIAALPAVQQIAAPATPAVYPIQAAMQPMAALPALPYPVHEGKGTFNKGDMMEMMMMQNAQMHHMVMQQMMLSHLPGGGGFNKGFGHGVPYTDVAPVSMVRQAPSVYHHHINSGPPQMDYRRGIGNRGPSRTYNTGVFYDDGTNYYTYH